MKHLNPEDVWLLLAYAVLAAVALVAGGCLEPGDVLDGPGAGSTTIEIEPAPCGAGEPCRSDADCRPGLVCPTEAEPITGFYGICVAPCSVGCCADGDWCWVAHGVGVCVASDAEQLGCPSAVVSCMP
jgi:hypothetical protein